MEKKIVKNDLFDYEERYIFQYENTFKFSVDSVLLSEFIIAKKNDVIVDFCTGLAPIPLILSKKYKNKIIGFEIQEEIFSLAKKSIEYNQLENQIKIINDDIKNYNKYFNKQSVDIISCNPPYFKVEETSIINKDRIEQISRHELLIKLEEIFYISSKILKDNGILYIVHRPERLDEIIILSDKYNIKVKEIVNIITKDNLEIKSVLVKCVKNSKNNIKLRILNINNRITYKNIFKEEK